MNTAPQSKKIFSTALLLEGRCCLVVGGGRVAARKAAKLAEAGADLTVVAPVIRERIQTLSGIHLEQRPFTFEDLDGAFLVFAVTDNPSLNRQIIDECRKKGILCSAADGNWPDGDLILPASFSEDGLTVTVSTGGRSCRRARLLRESLSRHVDGLKNVDVFILGVDHRTVNFQTLEKWKACRPHLEKILPRVRGIHEFMILDTCNRFEIIGLLSSDADLEALLEFILKGQSYPLVMDPQIGRPPLVKGASAFQRFAEIVAGLRSQAFGETRIVAQVKEALSMAQANQWAGSFLQGWVNTTLCISKEIRQVIEPIIPALEMEDLVFQWLEKKGNKSLAGGRILIVGRGEIGQGLVRKFPNSVQLSGRDFAELREQLPAADVVICATGNSHFMIDPTHRTLLRKGIVLIDLSLPRNIDPSLPNVIGLSELRRATPPARTKELLGTARGIIETHLSDFEQLMTF